MLKIAAIVGTARPGRRGRTVAEWVAETDPAEPGAATPSPHQRKTLTELPDDVILGPRGLRPVREGALT
ncbi:hypothetical protein ABT247_20865 [Kitasatospora sp. NPDC001539]|uniref:hypothetical protein n=1 Tax=Kitasatospora sp. NPDC001539 TaxID=3154384 RepID=UPI0033186E87